VLSRSIKDRLRYAIPGSVDMSRLFENAVLLELKRRPDLSIGYWRNMGLRLHRDHPSFNHESKVLLSLTDMKFVIYCPQERRPLAESSFTLLMRSSQYLSKILSFSLFTSTAFLSRPE
jgi:hypothetical protein